MIPIIKNRVRNRFDRAAATYDDAAEIQRTVVDDFISLFPPETYPSNSSVLEIGAGTGLLTRQVISAPHGPYIMSDISPALLRVGVRMLPDNNRISTKILDMDRLPESRKWNTVLSTSTFQWSENLPALFQSLFRSITPGGQLLFSMFVSGTLREIRAACEQSDLNFPGQDLPTSDYVENLLDTAGFSVFHRSEKRYTSRHKSGRDLLSSLRRTGTTAAGTTSLSVADVRALTTALEQAAPETEDLSLQYVSGFFGCQCSL